MSLQKTFVPLDKKNHDRESFDCDEDELNNFIRTLAAKHMEVGVSTTRLLPSLKPLANGKFSIGAFFTVAPGSIARSDLPQEFATRLPHYPIPVFLLAQLAVDRSYKGQGIGKVTLIAALEFLFKVNQHMAAYAVIVDCINSGAESFYLKFGFEELCKYNGRTRMFLPMKTIEQLFKCTSSDLS